MKFKTSLLHSVVLFAVVFLAACASPPSASQPLANTSAAPAANSLPAESAATATDQAAIPVTATDAPAATAPASAQPAQPAACTSPASLTPPMTEGPYFKSGSPEQANLVGTLPGMQLTLSGYVFTADCQPVANALLDFWQADSQGQYDNSGYTLRGHIFSDASGHYQIQTIVPGLYPGRTEHIHVKVKAPNGPVLTTQLFFPGVPQNQSDGIFDQRLLLTIQQQDSGLSATYNFIVAAQ